MHVRRFTAMRAYDRRDHGCDTATRVTVAREADVYQIDEVADL